VSKKIVDLGAHTNMTPEEALAVAQRRPWQKVLIIGFTEDSDGLVVMSSHMHRESALWIIKHAELHAMDRL
jgi:hypothetical protein